MRAFSNQVPCTQHTRDSRPRPNGIPTTIPPTHRPTHPFLRRFRMQPRSSEDLTAADEEGEGWVRAGEPEDVSRNSSGSGEGVERQDTHWHAMLGVNNVMVSCDFQACAFGDVVARDPAPVPRPPPLWAAPIVGQHRVGGTTKEGVSVVSHDVMEAVVGRHLNPSVFTTVWPPKGGPRTDFLERKPPVRTRMPPPPMQLFLFLPLPTICPMYHAA